MCAGATRFGDSSLPFISREPCKNSSKADAMVKDTQVAKRKLNNVGASILKEHLRLHPEDTHPTSHTLNALLEQVRGAQNNQDISYNSISSWFQRRRLKLQKQAPQSTAPLTPPTMPFSPDILRKLQTLVNATPNPSPDVLDVWASFFHVPKPMLHHAIHVILPEAAFQDASYSLTDSEQTVLGRLNTGPPLQRLPTPASSLTPEPILTGGTTEFMQKECNILTLGCSNTTGSECGVAAPSQQPRNYTTTESISAPVLDQMVHSQLSPPPTPIVPWAPVNSQASETGRTPTIAAPLYTPLTSHAIFSGIAEACVDALQNNQEDLRPKTAAEFQALFTPYETKLRVLFRMLETTLENAPADRSSGSRKST